MILDFSFETLILTFIFPSIEGIFASIFGLFIFKFSKSGFEQFILTIGSLLILLFWSDVIISFISLSLGCLSEFLTIFISRSKLFFGKCISIFSEGLSIIISFEYSS